GAVRRDDVDLEPVLHHRRAVAGVQAVGAGADLGLRAGAGCGALPGAAGADQRARRHRLVGALVSHHLPRGDLEGLRAHRARQGPVRARGAVPPRAAQRAEPDPDRGGGGDPAAVHGRPAGGILLRDSGPGQLHDRRHQRAGLRGGAGDGLHRLGALHRRPHPHRHLLHAGRSAGEAGMSAPPMDFQPVLLWTDALLFLLIGLGLLAVIHVRGQPPLREAWRKVGKRPTGMAAASVLLAFLAVGVLDSLHYRPLLPAVAAADASTSTAGENAAPAAVYSTEVLSALDALLTPLRAQTEKTYSAPFAWTLYQREAMELPDGRQVRDYPRLIHGAAHLDAPAEARAGDVAARLLRAVGQAALWWAGVFLALATLVWRGSGLGWGEVAGAMLSGRTVLAWRAALVTLGVLMLIVAA